MFLGVHVNVTKFVKLCNHHCHVIYKQYQGYNDNIYNFTKYIVFTMFKKYSIEKFWMEIPLHQSLKWKF